MKMYLFLSYFRLPDDEDHSSSVGGDFDSDKDLVDSTFSVFSAIKYTCSYSGCELQFKRKDQLDSHEYTHSKVRKFRCNEPGCDKTYVNNAHLQRHKRTVHTKSKAIFHCEVESCAAFFDSSTKLKQHLHKVHTDKTIQFECEICSQKFRRKTQLKQHMFVHTGCYRYKCDKCDKGFFQLGHLKRHEHSHRTHCCPVCSATFDKWSLFVAHKHKAHSQIENKCSICDRVFHSKSGLKYHSQVHTQPDDRIVYECSFDGCAKFFFHRNNMLAHFKSKHENKKFVCGFSDCGRELSTKQKLELHIKVVHPTDETTVNVQPKRKPKARAPRKDKGVPKKSTASKLFNFVLPIEVEKAILSGNGENIHLEYDQSDHEEDDNGKDDDRTASVPVDIFESSVQEATVQC